MSGMSSVKANPIIPIPKRTSGFSIASILTRDVKELPSASSGEDSDHGEDTSSQTLSNDDLPCFSHGQRIPPLHPTLPLHVQQLLLQDATGRIKPEVLALRPHAVTFGNQFGQFLGGLGPNGPVRPGIPQHIPTQSVFHQTMQTYPGLLAAAVAFSGRNSLAMYHPWMLNKPGADMLGYPFGHPEAGLFFHPYRKPKRIRTAFSPSQLLKLEHAFENNHYVVGQERKELASKLNLSETQVKVWFQNRRTKHKRVKFDDECDNGDISVDDDDEVASSSMTDTYNDHIEIRSDNS